jgi:hypothetical protein
MLVVYEVNQVLKRFKLAKFSSSARRTESDEDVTPTNSPVSMSARISPVKERRPSPLRHPDIKIFCESYELLFSKLVCPNCEEMMTSPIRFCSSGHCFCGKCVPWITLCTTCFKPLIDTHNKNLESLLTLTSFVCPFQPQGCTERTQVYSIKDHYKHCHFKVINCPVNQVKDMSCLWQGLRKDFPSHAKTHVNWHFPLPGHNHIIDSFSIVWPVKPEYAFIFVEDEIFLYSKCLFRDRWFCILQQAGMTKRKYECVFHLEGVNELDKISMRLAVKSTDESFALVYSFGHCFRMPARTIQHFIDEGFMNLMIYINDVTKPTNP